MATTTKPRKSPWPSDQFQTSDGRRQRSDRSRRKIIEALFELLREGEMSPTAVTVAARAKVGLRTVFRHFEDMESIFEEMTSELKAVTMPKVTAPLESTSWRESLLEVVDRNAMIYEDVFPMQVALLVRRFQSDFLTRQYKSEVALLRSSLKSFLPKEITSDRTLFAALEVNLSFATWQRLREDQNLSVVNATKTLKQTISALTADVKSKAR